jgi:D-beta-D-heptose 7-phosphate kinase/D-beta-D-heptose 1-phosphate adenosyltransferase
MDKISSWNTPLCNGEIASLGSTRKTLEIFRNSGVAMPKIILTSGGFDPVHPGHISVFNDCRFKAAAQTKTHIYERAILIVVVNGDEFLRRKKGAGFMPLKVRSQIVSSIRGVDIIVPFNPTDPTDMTVCEALWKLKPDVFAKGGDRTNIENIPEWDTCVANDIEIVTGCGDEKQWSSSNFLKDYLAANQ